jgi:hypothetical protein
MSRKQLEKFNPDTLRPGRSRNFETVGPKGYHDFYYFYRDRDGELFTFIGPNGEGEKQRKVWQKLKRAKPDDLKQTSFIPVIGPGVFG